MKKKFQIHHQERMIVLRKVLKENVNSRIILPYQKKESELDYLINQLIEKYQTKILENKNFESQQKKLLSNLSHDIRTPITSILGYASALEEGLVKDYEFDSYLKILVEKSSNLKSLVEEMFELSKIESKDYKFNKKRIDLCECLRQTLINFFPELKKRCFDVDFQIPEGKILIYADEIAIDRAFQNLIKNAIQHGKNGKFLGVYLIENEEFLKVEIEDRGKGIPKEKQALVFERLFKLDDSRKLSANSNGLGLAISKSIFDEHKCKIDLNSNKEKTKFIVTIPHMNRRDKNENF